MEIKQFHFGPRRWVKNLWNYIEIAPQILIICNIISEMQPDFYQDVWYFRFQSLNALFMWARAIHMLKFNKSIGYLIYSMDSVMQDMKTFLFVLCLAIIGFALSFFSMSRSLAYKPGDDGFAPYLNAPIDALKFSYKSALGDFDTDDFDEWNWIIFLFASILEVVVMLNLLIAIISATFERVASQEFLYTYKELAAMI